MFVQAGGASGAFFLRPLVSKHIEGAWGSGCVRGWGLCCTGRSSPGIALRTSAGSALNAWRIPFWTPESMLLAACELNAKVSDSKEGLGAPDNGAAGAGLTIKTVVIKAREEAMRERFTVMRALSNEEGVKTN